MQLISCVFILFYRAFNPGAAYVLDPNKSRAQRVCDGQPYSYDKFSLLMLGLS